LFAVTREIQHARCLTCSLQQRISGKLLPATAAVMKPWGRGGALLQEIEHLCLHLILPSVAPANKDAG